MATAFDKSRIYTKMKVTSFLLMIIISACGKPDEIAPVINITFPTQNQNFSGGQSVIVQATITDNIEIHSVHLSVLDNTTNGHVIHLEQHLDTKNYNLYQSFFPQAGRSYTIEIEATDHNQNTSKKQLNVSAN